MSSFVRTAQKRLYGHPRGAAQRYTLTDLSYIILHPTRGYRKVSKKRAGAQAKMMMLRVPNAMRPFVNA